MVQAFNPSSVWCASWIQRCKVLCVWFIKWFLKTPGGFMMSSSLFHQWWWTFWLREAYQMRLLPGDGTAESYERGWLDYACRLWSIFQDEHRPPESLGSNCLAIVSLIYLVITGFWRDGVLIFAFAWEFISSFYDCSWSAVRHVNHLVMNFLTTGALSHRMDVELSPRQLASDVVPPWRRTEECSMWKLSCRRCRKMCRTN